MKCSCSNSQRSHHGESREKAAPLPPPLASSVRQLCLQAQIYRYKHDPGHLRASEDGNVFKFLVLCIPSSVSWCVVSDAEEKKCLDLSGNATAHHIKGTLQCVRGLNSRDCMARIKVAGQDKRTFLCVWVQIFLRGDSGMMVLVAGPLRTGQQMRPPCLRMTSTPLASATAWSWLQENPITERVSLISPVQR